MRAMRAFRSQQVRPVRFHAELVTGLNLARGVGPASYTRNTTATVFDQDNVLRTVAANEARFSGARRVQNLLSYSEDHSNAKWEKLGTAVVTQKAAPGPFPGTLADKVAFTSNSHALVQKAAVAIPGRKYRYSWYAKQLSGTYTRYSVYDWTNLAEIYAPTIYAINNTWRRFSVTFTAPAGCTTVGVYPTRNSDIGEILIYGELLEDITGQENQAPGEYVSTNVLSFPYHGAGVDGVKYFDTTNGNTVDANRIVTEAAGLPLAPWIYGRFGKQFITYDPWVASTAYAANAGAIPVRQNGYYYTASAGTSGATEPAWPTTIGATVTDGTITWTCKGYYKLFGYLAEGQRTNSLLQCRNFADAAWTNSASAVTATQNAVGIDGAANTAWTLEVTDGMNQFKTQAVTVANDGNTHTVSIWVPKTGTATFSGLGFTLTGGTTALQAQFTFNSLSGLATARAGNAAGATATVELVGSNWWVQVSCANNTTGNVTLTQGIFPCVATSDSGTWTAALTGNCIFDWAQCELNAAFASYPILTTTAAVTRSSDVLTYPGSGNLPQAGTVGADVLVNMATNYRFAVGGGGAFGAYLNGASQAVIGKISSLDSRSSPYPTNEIFRVSGTWTTYEEPGNCASFIDGAKKATGTSTFSAGTYIYIGHRGNVYPLFGNVRNVKVLKRALLDSEIADL